MNDEDNESPENPEASGQMLISLADLRGVPVYQTAAGSVVILTGITAPAGTYELLVPPEPPEFADQPEFVAPMHITAGFEAIGQDGDSKGWYPLSKLYDWQDGKRTILKKTYGEYCAEQLKS